NDLHGDATARGDRERPRYLFSQRSPHVRINLGPECRFERVVRIALTKEISMSDKETFFVVVRVDKPARDAARPIAPDFTCCWVEDVDTFHVHHQVPVRVVEDIDVRVTKDYEEVALTGRFQVPAHM